MHSLRIKLLSGLLLLQVGASGQEILADVTDATQVFTAKQSDAYAFSFIQSQSDFTHLDRPNYIEHRLLIKVMSNAALLELGIEGGQASVLDQLKSKLEGFIVRRLAIVPGLRLWHTRIDTLVALERARETRGVVYAEAEAIAWPVEPVDERLLSISNATTNVTWPNDCELPQQWYLEHPFDHDIDASNWWIRSVTPPFPIAVLDKGINDEHTDLKQNIYLAESAGSEIGAYDSDGHGSMISGLIGAKGNNRKGIAGFHWSCKLASIAVLGAGAPLSYVADGIDRAIKLGAVVINCSFTIQLTPKVVPDLRAIGEAIARAGFDDVIIVAAVGNNDVDIEKTPMFPASFDHFNVVGVMATDLNGKPWYDSVGSGTNWGSLHADLAAPGQWIMSTYNPDDEYATKSGSSFSAALVSSLLAAYLAANPTASSREAIEALVKGSKSRESLKRLCRSGGIATAKAIP